MSTNSIIGYVEDLKKKDVKFNCIYCHWDGYIENGVGEMLFEHYQDPEKIKKLIALGDISCLGEEIDPKGEHSFDNPEKGVTIAYHRDRNEPFRSLTLDNWEEVVDACHRYEFVYLFDMSKKTWYVFDSHGMNPLRYFFFDGFYYSVACDIQEDDSEELVMVMGPDGKRVMMANTRMEALDMVDTLNEDNPFEGNSRFRLVKFLPPIK